MNLRDLRYLVALAEHKHFGRAAEASFISQPTLSHHLKKLRDAGVVDSERRGLWAYYYVIPDALDELSAWLT